MSRVRNVAETFECNHGCDSWFAERNQDGEAKDVMGAQKAILYVGRLVNQRFGGDDSRVILTPKYKFEEGEQLEDIVIDCVGECKSEAQSGAGNPRSWNIYCHYALS